MTQFLMALPHEVPAVWPMCKDLLAKSFFRHVHTYGVDDLYDPLLTGEFQLWAAVRDGQVIGAAVTVIEEGRKAKVLSVLNLGGEDIKDWIASLDKAFTLFARQNNCLAYEAVTRKGFSRLVPGFIEDGVVYVKFVNEDTDV